jgi:hypothetical protein
VREAYRAAQELERLAARIGHIPALSVSRRRLAWIEFWNEPNLDQLEDKMLRDFDPPIEGAEPFFGD